jgi:endonuclease/exonuclease/phosphatase family metal-dependent hydrolase
MRTLPLLILVGACMQHANPTDPSLESTFPKSPAAETLPRQLRVVELNVHMVDGATIVRGIDKDPALRGADLIMLEEVHRDDHLCSGACELGKHLGFYSVYAPGHVHGDGTDGVALLSRSPILSAEVLELPRFDTHVNSQRKVAIEATVEIDGKPVTVYAVHLDNRITVNERRRQMLPILQQAAKQTTPVIIAGDFNTSPFNWLWRLIPVPTGTQDDRLEDFVRAYGFDTPVKNSGPTSRWLAMKLDGIYTRGFQTVAYDTADADDISDHFAMWAVLKPKS